jgi:hypothetical protein
MVRDSSAGDEFAVMVTSRRLNLAPMRAVYSALDARPLLSLSIKRNSWRTRPSPPIHMRLAYGSCRRTLSFVRRSLSNLFSRTSLALRPRLPATTKRNSICSLTNRAKSSPASRESPPERRNCPRSRSCPAGNSHPKLCCSCWDVAHLLSARAHNDRRTPGSISRSRRAPSLLSFEPPWLCRYKNFRGPS